MSNLNRRCTVCGVREANSGYVCSVCEEKYINLSSNNAGAYREKFNTAIEIIISEGLLECYKLAMHELYNRDYLFNPIPEVYIGANHSARLVWRGTPNTFPFVTSAELTTQGINTGKSERYLRLTVKTICSLSLNCCGSLRTTLWYPNGKRRDQAKMVNIDAFKHIILDMGDSLNKYRLFVRPSDMRIVKHQTSNNSTYNTNGPKILGFFYNNGNSDWYAESKLSSWTDNHETWEIRDGYRVPDIRYSVRHLAKALAAYNEQRRYSVVCDGNKFETKNAIVMLNHTVHRVTFE